MEEDSRFLWLKSVLISSFELGDTETMDRFLASDEGKAINIIDNFLAHHFTASARGFLTFYVTTEQAEIEEEIFTLIGNGICSPTELQPVPSSNSFTSVAEKEDDESVDDEKSSDSDYETQLKTREASAKTAVGDASKVSGEETAGNEQVEPQKIIIKRTILVTTLQMLVDTFPDANVKSFLFVLRSTCCPVPTDPGTDFLKYIDLLFISGNLLSTFIHLTSEVYIPVVESSVGSSRPNLSHESKSMVLYEEYASKLALCKVLEDLKDFAAYIDQVVATNRKMKMLQIDASLCDCTSLEQLEALHVGWANRLAEMISAHRSRVQNAGNPLELILGWKESHVQLAFMEKEFPKPRSENLQNDTSQVFQRYNLKYDEMTSLLKESRDIARVAPALIPHFKIIVFGQNLDGLKSDVEYLLASLRVIWSASEYFSVDSNMENLLLHIVNHLNSRTIHCVDIKSLCRVPLYKLKTSSYQGLELLSCWKQAYYSTRSQIESEKCEVRWEFDRNQLFAKSDHIARVCKDLYDSAVLIEEVFHCFVPKIVNAFGLQDDMLKLQAEAENLLDIVNSISFDPFRIQHEASWMSVMEMLRRECNNMAEKLKHFFDSAFKNATSAEDVVDFISQLFSSPCREDIKKHLLKKGSEVTALFLKELDTIQGNISNENYNPAGHWSQTEIYVKINWAKLSTNHVLRLRQKYELLPELLKSEHESCVESKCSFVIEEFARFQKREYEKWLLKSTANLLELLFVPVLHKNDDMTFSVNFPDQLLEIISECAALEREGFKIPSSLKNAVLQRAKFTNHRVRLCAIMRKLKMDCNCAIWSSGKVSQVESLLNQGTKRLSWNSAGIESYINSLQNMAC